jgi:CheY-like chemotaxis protein
VAGTDAGLAVLVVDDDEAMRRMLCLALSRRGHAVEIASGGEEAVRLLRRRPFDVLISDIHMPDVDGISLCEIARGIRPRIGVILMTGYQTAETVLAGFSGGASAYVR